MKKILLFDWGNTIMKDFPDEKGKMYKWKKVETMPNAEKALKELSKIANCYLATNAKDSEKKDIRKALRRVCIDEYFKDVFCFQEIGYMKPSIEYFNSIMDKLNVSNANLVMIGDNLESDIYGAKNAGIDAILYDPDRKHRDFTGNRIDDLLLLKEYI